MNEFEKYSSLEAYEVAAMAREKGLLLLESTYGSEAGYPEYGDNNRRGFCVVKVIGGQWLTLEDHGSVFQNHGFSNSSVYGTVRFNLTLAQAKEQIMNFDGIIKNPPKFFAYVRVYDGEPEYFGYIQCLYLEEFARQNGISYEERFVCIGGPEFTEEEGKGFDDILDCCEKSLLRLKENPGVSYLVVSDISRLDDELEFWRQTFEMVFLCYEEMPIPYKNYGYTKYSYHAFKEIEKVQQEYEQMTEEHRQMMMEQDEPFIEGVEENE